MKNKKEDASMLEQKWYTVADVAALTGLTGRTIRNYLKDGTLHGKKVGVQWRFTENDIEALFQEADHAQELTEARDNLVADFLRKTDRTEEMECRIVDIPRVEEELWKKNLKKLRQEIGEKRGGAPDFAWEYETDGKLLRIAVVGRTKDAEWLIKRVKKGMKTDAE